PWRQSTPVAPCCLLSLPDFLFRSPLLPCLSPFSSTPTPPALLYPLSLHDALPISPVPWPCSGSVAPNTCRSPSRRGGPRLWHSQDRKSTRLNSSHGSISYAVFCLKKKKN